MSKKKQAVIRGPKKTIRFLPGRGAESKLTPELHQQFVAFLEAGNYAVTTCTLCNVSEVQFYDWLKKAEAGREPFATFAADVKAATAKAEHSALSTLKAMPLGWQAQAWFLERRFRGRWAKDTDRGMTNMPTVPPPSVEPEDPPPPPSS